MGNFRTLRVSKGTIRGATLSDTACTHLGHLTTLAINAQDLVTTAAFAHIRGLTRLYINRCGQITDAAFVHLIKIQWH
jgi:hypothetical protein